MEPAPPQQSVFSRADHLTAALTAFGVLFCYTLALPTQITGEDAGELAAAAYVLGIPHPPGYPLWCLLAHAFTWLPIYTVAWRVALFSAVMAAAAIYVLVLLALFLTRSRLAAVVGALLLSVMPPFLSQSLVPEVYTLNAFFIALCWLLLALWHQQRSDRLLWWLAVAYGLSLGNHNTMIILGPLFAIFVLLVERPPLKRWRMYALWISTSLLIAFALYCYLPIRSLANPPIDWGNPETLANWWRHVTRGQYDFMLTQAPRSLERFATFLWRDEIFSPLFLGTYGVFALLGFATCYKKPAVPGLVLVSGVLAYFVFLFIQNPAGTIEWHVVMRVFAIPLCMCAVVGIAILVQRIPPTFRFFVWPFLLVPASVNAAIYADVSISGAPLVEGYARRILQCLPANAILIPSADHQSFPVQYLQVVEGLRPDVTIGRKYGYLDTGNLGLDAEEFPRRRREPELLNQLLATTDRPVYFFGKPKVSTPSPWQQCWAMTGVGGTCSPECEIKEADSLAAEIRTDDYTSKVISMELHFLLADRSDAGNAKMHLEAGLRAYGRDSTSLYNAGAVAARRGMYDDALRYFEEALQVDAAHQPSIDAIARLAVQAP